MIHLVPLKSHKVTEECQRCPSIPTPQLISRVDPRGLKAPWPIHQMTGIRWKLCPASASWTTSRRSARNASPSPGTSWWAGPGRFDRARAASPWRCWFAGPLEAYTKSALARGCDLTWLSDPISKNNRIVLKYKKVAQNNCKLYYCNYIDLEYVVSMLGSMRFNSSHGTGKATSTTLGTRLSRKRCNIRQYCTSGSSS